MNNSRKKRFATVAMVISVVIIFMGFLTITRALGGETIDGQWYYDAGYASFGGDFYTYVNNNAAIAANNLKEQNELLTNVCGIFLMGFGSLGLCFFGIIRCSSDDWTATLYQMLRNAQTAPQTTPQATPQTASQTVPQAAPQTVSRTVPQAAPQTVSRTVPQAAPQTTPQTASQTAPQVATETASQDVQSPKRQIPKSVVEPPAKESSLASKLTYALRFSTDKGMINYLRGIDDPVVLELLKAPENQIRGLVEKALSDL